MALNPVTFIEGFNTNPGFLTTITSFESHGDFVNYMERLRGIPQMVCSTLK